jgi:hypothetical protein
MADKLILSAYKKFRTFRYIQWFTYACWQTNIPVIYPEDCRNGSWNMLVINMWHTHYTRAFAGRIMSIESYFECTDMVHIKKALLDKLVI